MSTAVDIFDGFLDDPAPAAPLSSPAPVAVVEPPPRPDFVPVGAIIGDEQAREIHRAAAARPTKKSVKVDSNVLEVPPPEVPAHLIELTDPMVPRGARTIGNLATKCGFTLLVSHARGPYIGDQPVRVMRIVDSVLIRMWHEDGRRAGATWTTQVDPEEWGLEACFLITPVFKLVKSGPFKEYLRDAQPFIRNDGS